MIYECDKSELCGSNFLKPELSPVSDSSTDCVDNVPHVKRAVTEKSGYFSHYKQINIENFVKLKYIESIECLDQPGP